MVTLDQQRLSQPQAEVGVIVGGRDVDAICTQSQEVGQRKLEETHVVPLLLPIIAPSGGLYRSILRGMEFAVDARLWS